MRKTKPPQEAWVVGVFALTAKSLHLEAVTAHSATTPILQITKTPSTWRIWNNRQAAEQFRLRSQALHLHAHNITRLYPDAKIILQQTT